MTSDKTVPALVTDRLSHSAFVFAFIASAGGLVSIALSHTCLAIALALLIVSKTPLRMPPIALPLLGFCGLTAASMVASDNPAAGWPQIKKFFVFAFLVVIYSLFRKFDQAHRLLQAWFVLGLLAAVLSIVQFAAKWRAAGAGGQDFYERYIGERISGFFSHWMTYSEVTLLVFLVLVSYLMFAERARSRSRTIWFGCGIVFGLSLVLSFTRSVWLALLVSSMYLIWNWRPRLLFAAPVAVAVAIVLAPGAARQRIESIVNPAANPARLLMWQTGWQMIQAHPWLGVGPEQVGPRFREFVPEEVEKLPDAYYGHLHNVYIHYAAERGVPAALMILWLLAKILWDHTKGLAKLPCRRNDRRFLLHAVVASTLAVIVVGCFDLTLGDSEILAAYLTLVALGYGVAAVPLKADAKLSRS